MHDLKCHKLPAQKRAILLRSCSGTYNETAIPAQLVKILSPYRHLTLLSHPQQSAQSNSYHSGEHGSLLGLMSNALTCMPVSPSLRLGSGRDEQSQGLHCQPPVPSGRRVQQHLWPEQRKAPLSSA